MRHTFGKKNVGFARKNQLKFFNKAGTSNFTFIIRKINTESGFFRVAIDYSDSNTITDEESYKWADVYGKVNTNWKITPEVQYPKIKCLASNFGVRCFDHIDSIVFAIRNCLIINPVNKIKFLAKYLKQNNKLWQSQIPKSKSEKGYLFSLNTLWYSDEWNRLDENTNKFRADFMETCLRLPKIQFEGGFVPSFLGNNNYTHLHLKKPFSHRAYCTKLMRSLAAFNTPAVWNCHGWKLSEFLCMGKAIISTPLSNDLPSPLVHGESVHFVKDKSEFEDAIILLNDNSAYRKKLENGARNYYENFVSPQAVFKILGIV